jgi:hypothetical protein
MVNVMLEFNRSLLNREYTLMNVLKALASIIFMCNLKVTLLSKLTRRYFAICKSGIFRPFNVRQDSGGRRLREMEISLILIIFDIAVLTQSLQ